MNTLTPTLRSSHPAHQPELATLPDIRRTALDRLEPAVADFLEGGAGDETTMAANGDAYRRWGFNQQVMSGRGSPDLSTTFLGIPLAMPVLTAPFGADRLFHPDGQQAVARANETAGIASIAPEAGSCSLEEIATASPIAARIAQLHPMGPVDNFTRMIERVRQAGYQALCLTLDCPTAGWRERLLRNAWMPPDQFVAGNYPPGSDVTLGDVFGQLFQRSAAVWSWQKLADIMAGIDLPWIAKGVITPADALAAEAAGAAAIYVSNHGGRQLDGVPASLDALTEIAPAIDGRLPIALDSGIRRGADIIKAIALGADVVVLGRLSAYGLAAAGQEGVEQVHTLLRDEMRTVLTLLGHGSIKDLGPDALVRTPR